jgi:hypothetical protein
LTLSFAVPLLPLLPLLLLLLLLLPMSLVAALWPLPLELKVHE